MPELKHTKRDATPDEIEQELKANMERWNRNNPSRQIPEKEWRKKQEEAVEQGYKAEVCGFCSVTFLAFHHFTICREPHCPFSTGESVLDTMQRSLNEETTENG